MSDADSKPMPSRTPTPEHASAEPADELVRVEQVTKEFDHEGKVLGVLKGIDLVVRPREMVCVVGASGAGKSTLLHLMGTLDLPSSGRILYGGQDVTSLPGPKLAEFRNKSIGFVFQFHHLLPEFTAVENVMMPGLIQGRPRAEMNKAAKELLGEVGLSNRLNHRPGELSGGEQQRVALARALIRKPQLVLADEPTGNLDSATSDAVHELFFELNRSRGTTFLIVTHSRDLAGRMPRVVSMKDGLIEKDERRQTQPTDAQSAAPEPASAAPDDPRQLDTA